MRRAGTVGGAKGLSQARWQEIHPHAAAPGDLKTGKGVFLVDIGMEMVGPVGLEPTTKGFTVA